MVGIPGIIGLLVALFFGGSSVLGGGDGDFEVGTGLEGFPGAAPPAEGAPLEGAPDPDAELVDYVSFLLDDIQETWTSRFSSAGKRYQDAELVLFTDATQSACGGATSDIGPHYCPVDKTVYLDLEFFRQLKSRFGAPGDFAQAYVVAHEIAHHVQNLLGINNQVRQESQRNPDEANELSVRQELQADCLAGVWAHTTYQRGILEEGDLQEGLDAAAAVGDDRIQKQATGRTNPETWTHGSSQQRMRWFTVGYDSGDPDRCDTFSAKRI
jgi:uncharacterized protein